MPGPAATIPERLKKGAEILGKLWREGVRCGEDWSVLCPADNPLEATDCFCEPKNKFCLAKKQWLSLVIDDPREEFHGPLGIREIEQGPFGILMTMRGTEWDATGVTVQFDFPGIGLHGIGPKGIMSRGDLIKLFKEPSTLSAIIKLMKKFPGMKVEGVLEPGQTEVEVPPSKDEEIWKDD